MARIEPLDAKTYSVEEISNTIESQAQSEEDGADPPDYPADQELNFDEPS